MESQKIFYEDGNPLYICSRGVTPESAALLNPNPSTGTITGTMCKENVLGRIRLQRLATIRWLFVWGKGTRFKENFWGTSPDNRDIQYIPIHFLVNRGPRAPMTQECIPFLF